MRSLIGLGRPWQMAASLLMVTVLVLGTRAQDETTVQRMQRDLAFLAGDECEGRGIETKGLEKAANYIAKQFEQAGLKPGGKDGGWFQPFTIRGPAKLQPGNKLILHGPQGQSIELQEGKQFTVLGFSSAAKLKGPVIFVGYGLSVPHINFDDYKDIDVKDKVVVVVRRVPRWDNQQVPFDGDRKDQHASLIGKIANAELHQAAAVLLVNDTSEVKDPLAGFQDHARGFSTGGSLPVLHVKRTVVDAMLLSSLGQGLPEIEKAIDRDLKPHSAVLPGWSAEVETLVTRKQIQVKNVIGVVEGSGPLANEIVVIGAHYDHLGYGEPGSLAFSPEERKKIHHGADDNGSGTTSVMELARRFGGMKNRAGRKLVFMTFSGEEKGLLGSQHYCNREPLFPLEATVAMVNLDMVGRSKQPGITDGKGRLIAEGVGTGKGFKELIEKVNAKYDFDLTQKQGGIGPSDHSSFCEKRIPVFFLWTGIHKDYHRPSDTFDKIDYQDMARIADLATDVITYLTTVEKRPEYVQIATPIKSSPGAGNIPRLGIRPAYDTDKKGLLVDGVTPGGPADKGGLKAGDLIIIIGDQPITNIDTYMAVLAKQRRGQPLAVTVLRAEKKVTLQVTPQ